MRRVNPYSFGRGRSGREAEGGSGEEDRRKEMIRKNDCWRQ
jgi:hypothetical protein